MTEKPTEGAVEFSLQWMGIEDVPVLLANQFIGQVGQQGEVVLTFGQVVLPALLGTPEQQLEQARGISEVPIRPLARLGVTRQGLDELLRVLEQTRANYDKAQKMRNGGEEI